MPSYTAGAEKLKTAFPSALAARVVGGIEMLSYLEGKCQAEDNAPAGWENWAAGGFCVALSAKAPGPGC